VEVSYVGSRSKKLQTSTSLNNPGLSVRQSCNPLEGGSPAYCNAPIANPYFGLEHFAGTSIGTSPTLSRYDLSRPFNQFGSISLLGGNKGKLWYDSMQVNYSIRAAKSLNLSLAYTFSKQMEGTSYRDEFKGIMNHQVASMNLPHQLRVSTIYQLPFGKGQHFLGNAGWLLDALVGGWEQSTILQYTSGRPWTPPSNARYVREAKLEANWDDAVVKGIRPCVAQMSDAGAITLMSYSASLSGCTLDNYNFLVLPNYAPSEGSRDGRIRNQAKPMFDMSLAKSFIIRENMRVQLRAEAFNVFNSFLMTGASFDNNTSSSSFGQIDKSAQSTMATSVSRNVQLAVKLIF
jgi:hypothetical protein